MSNFIFRETPIKDAYFIETKTYMDERGYSMETYNYEFETFVKHIDGVPCKFVQENQSNSKYGVLRGLHFQKKNPQGKLVRVIDGEIYDVIVDLRKNSTTFKKWYGVILNSENKYQLLVPEGCAHGFITKSKTALVLYKLTRYYDPTDEAGLLWCDEEIGVNWNFPKKEAIILNEKDKNNPVFNNLKFLY